MTLSKETETNQSRTWSAAELAAAVNRWCEERGVLPMSPQAAAALTERNIHYYRSLGLVSAPARGRGRGFEEKHFLQLIAIRILQAKGLPHRRIQELLYGRSLEDLREIRDKGLTEHEAAAPVSSKFEFSSAESWRMIPISDEYLLVNRSGRSIDPDALRLIREILSGQTAPEQ